MDRDLLSHLPTVVCVARHRSFAAAAAELAMSPSAVSHAVRSVEDRLGAPLFARTTRSVSLTEAGARFIAGVEPALADIGKAVEGLTAERGQVTRLLRIEAPRGVLDTLLIPILSTGANRTSPFLVSTAYRYGQEMPGGVPPKTAPDTRYRFALDPQIDRRNLVGRRGRRAFVPTPEQRRNVKILAGLGIPQDKICLTVVNPHTDKPLDQ